MVGWESGSSSTQLRRAATDLLVRPVERAPSNLQKTSKFPVTYLLLGVPNRVFIQLVIGVAYNQPIAGFPVLLPFHQLTVHSCCQGYPAC
jgi:hypothetical protein